MPIKPVSKIGLAGQYLPLSIARMLWKRRALTAAVTLLLTIPGAWYVHRMPKIYRSDAVILVDAQKIPERFVASTVQASLADSLNSISQQVLSSDRLMVIVNDLGLYPEARRTKLSEEVLEMMREDLTIKVEKGFADGKAGAFRISYEGPDAEADAKVVSRVTDLFIRENLRNREQRAEGTSDFLQSQLDEAKKSLDQQEASLSGFKSKFIGELPEQETSLLSALSRLQLELQSNQESINRAQQSRTVLDTTLRLAENAKSSLERVIAQQRLAAATPVTAQTEAVRRADPLASEKLRAELETLKSRYYDGHPEVRRVQAELSQALAAEARSNAALAAQAKKSGDPAPEVAVARPTPTTYSELGAISAELKIETERAATAKAQIETIEQEIKARNTDRDRIQAELGGYEKRVETLPVREQQMAGLTRDYETSKMNYRSLLDKKMSAGMARDMERKQQSEGFEIADPAHVPNIPIRPHRAAYYGATLFGALAFGLLLAFALEIKADTFLGEWELPPGVAVLGRIPRVLEGNS